MHIIHHRVERAEKYEDQSNTEFVLISIYDMNKKAYLLKKK
jgi:hypothetical protein